MSQLAPQMIIKLYEMKQCYVTFIHSVLLNESYIHLFTYKNKLDK